MRQTRRAFGTAIGLIALHCAACGSNQSTDRIAETYAAILIAAEQYKADSAQRHETIDSIARAGGFDGPTEVWEAVENTGRDANELRLLLDSTAAQLNRVAE